MQVGLLSDAAALLQYFKDSKTECLIAGHVDDWVHCWFQLNLLLCTRAVYSGQAAWAREVALAALQFGDLYEKKCRQKKLRPRSWSSLRMRAFKAWGNAAWLGHDVPSAAEAKEIRVRLTMLLAVQAADGGAIKNAELRDSAIAMVLKGTLRSAGLNSYRSFASSMTDSTGLEYPIGFQGVHRATGQRDVFLELCLALSSAVGASDTTIQFYSDALLQLLMASREAFDAEFYKRAMATELQLALDRRPARSALELAI